MRFKTTEELAAAAKKNEQKLPAPPPANGSPYLTLDYRPDGVYLTTHTALGGRRMSAPDSILYLTRKRVSGFLRDEVTAALNAPETPYKIAPPQEEFGIDESISCTVVGGGASATLTLSPPDGGCGVGWPEIHAALTRAGVVFGVDIPACARLLKDKPYGRAVVVALSLPPIRGIDGSLEFLFQRERRPAPTERSDGRADYRNLGLIENVERGQTLVIAHPPVPGTDGMTVLGLAVPFTAGKAMTLPAGRGCDVSPDGGRLVASLSGRVEWEDRRVCVYDRYEVGDVNFAVGNIDFVGDVVIRGQVPAGFSIRARNIEVHGVVEGAKLIAALDIVLKGGIRGANAAYLSAGRHIQASFIEGTKAELGGNLYAESIIQSTVDAQGRVVVSGKKAIISASSVRAMQEIVVSLAGSPSFATTHLEVGVSPLLLSQLDQQSALLSRRESECNRFSLLLERLEQLAQRGELSPERQSQRETTAQMVLRLSAEIARLREETGALRERLEQVSDGAVHVRNIAYPGVYVHVSQQIYKIIDSVSFSTFKLHQGEIVILPFSATQ